MLGRSGCALMGKVEDAMLLMLECPFYEARREIMLRARGVAGVAAVNAENMRMMLNGNKYPEWKAIAQYINACYKLRSEQQKVAEW